jgi:hypothetical protein
LVYCNSPEKIRNGVKVKYEKNTLKKFASVALCWGVFSIIIPATASFIDFIDEAANKCQKRKRKY